MKDIKYKNSLKYDSCDHRLYAQVPYLTGSINDFYPGHIVWLRDKFFKELSLNDNKRGYSFAVDYGNYEYHYHENYGAYKLAGCALLKNTPEEKKLCCLFVDPEYRGMGIATELVYNAMELLKTNKPFLSISENNLPQLQGIINKFNFELTSIKKSIYKPGIKEYYFNEQQKTK